MFFYEYVVVIVLVFTRIAAMFSIIPIFGARNTPMTTKVGLVFFISLIFVPLQIGNLDIQADTFLEYGALIVNESIIGFSIGLITLIILNVFYLAGSLVDRNIGFAMVSVVSAQDESQLPVSANLYYIFALMIFIVTNVHHELIRAIAMSYETMPIGSSPILRLITFDYVDLLHYTFEMGFKMAAPFILTVLIANLLLGLLSKAMPGMNVFMIGMPLKILVGLFLFTLLMPLYPDFIMEIFNEMMRHIYRLIGIG
ncbi:flagellar biosynthetic protein FliR [Acidaminobacter sp. JC074]|uniref:flagellar biosynthetic protein FliR n=1 Tax=Acidaminobacter sp. JC074 TaxID=2530199 RepID=UPI001F0CEB2D|nr:flagellar biosynthetic protein FliR [Acidaminobacter sp. JC074]MCH4888737.1 flagellar biosynthetic protein FliR [Acidaminobacter sp. JC074]